MSKLRTKNYVIHARLLKHGCQIGSKVNISKILTFQIKICTAGLDLFTFV